MLGGFSAIDLQVFAQLPVVALFAVIVLKMLEGFKQYLKERDDQQAKVTADLTTAIAAMSQQIHNLAISLTENKGKAKAGT